MTTLQPALDLKGESITQYDRSAIGLTVHEPVVGIITPWNFPLLLVSEDCTCSGSRLHNGRKPSEFTPSSTFMLAEIITQAGLRRVRSILSRVMALSLGNGLSSQL